MMEGARNRRWEGIGRAVVDQQAVLLSLHGGEYVRDDDVDVAVPIDIAELGVCIHVFLRRESGRRLIREHSHAIVDVQPGRLPTLRTVRDDEVEIAVVVDIAEVTLEPGTI